MKSRKDLPPVKRPPIKGVSTYIPERVKEHGVEEDAELSRQIVSLVSRRKELRNRMGSSPKPRSPAGPAGEVQGERKDPG